MVSAMGSQDFLQGECSSGYVMPHAEVHIEHPEQAGQQLPAGEVGQVVVRSGAIAHNYHAAPSPQFSTSPQSNPQSNPQPSSRTFYTDDLGYLDTQGQLHITGRASRKIISGGENIFPEEIEAQLHSTQQILDVCVLGLPHPDWGEAVTAIYVPASQQVTPTSLKLALINPSGPELSRYKIPRQWLALPKLPRNAQGKVNRSALRQQAMSQPLESVD